MGKDNYKPRIFPLNKAINMVDLVCSLTFYANAECMKQTYLSDSYHP